jgi:hypothetical protein
MTQRKQRKATRESKNLPKKMVVFFESEGSTETNYLKNLHLIIRNLGSDINFDYGKNSGGQSPKKCVENLIHTKRSSGADGDLFIAICDVDDFDKRNKNGTLSDLQKAVQLAKQNEIKLLISNICFEQWLEFHRSDDQYKKEEDQNNIIKNELSKLVARDKNFIKNNIEKAHKRAKEFDDLKGHYPKNYGSRMWQLLEILAEYFPDLVIIPK